MDCSIEHAQPHPLLLHCSPAICTERPSSPAFHPLQVQIRGAAVTRQPLKTAIIPPVITTYRSTLEELGLDEEGNPALQPHREADAGGQQEP